MISRDQTNLLTPEKPASSRPSPIVRVCRPLLSAIFAVALLSSATPVLAQETVGSPESSDEVPSNMNGGDYKGVVPGKHDVVEHSRVARLKSRASNELTWVGYQKQEGKDRVFLQFSSMPYYSISEDGQKLIVQLDDTAPTLKNFVRLIDTSGFKSRVQKIDTSHKKGKTTVTITFDGANNSSTSTENGYLFIDFPQ